MESYFSKKLHFYMWKRQHRKPYKVTKDIFISPLDKKGEVVGGADIGKILKYPWRKKTKTHEYDDVGGGGGEGEEKEEVRIKVMRTRVYLKAAAED